MRGSLKVKQTYDHLKENGDVAALSGGGSNARNPHDFDIKLLQAKRQQAEMKRSVADRVRPTNGQSPTESDLQTLYIAYAAAVYLYS